MPNHGDAFDFLTREGPSIFGTVGSMLYVGHRHDTHPWWHRTFAPLVGATRLAVVDIDPHNLGTARHITDELYLGDIRSPQLPTGFGLVFWDEGPEHMAKEESLALCQLLAGRNRRVLVSCPWGFQPQGTDPSDPEFHHWGPMPEDFDTIGWTARTFGVMFDGRAGHGNLIAWSPV